MAKKLMVKDIMDTYNPEQLQVVHFLMGVDASERNTANKAIISKKGKKDRTVQDVLDTFNEEQLDTLYFLLGKVIENEEAAKKKKKEK